MMLSQFKKLTSLPLVAVRPFHYTSKLLSPQQSPLFKLRQKTGLAYNLCREALVKHNNDVDEAEAWLKAQELAHGLQKATKVRGRSAKEGLIGVAVGKDNKIVTVLELNCETDFVAKNQLFKDFAIDLTQQFAESRQICEVTDIKDQKFIQELKPSSEVLEKLDQQIVPFITKLGENIKIHRANHFQTNDSNTHLFGQVHAQAGKASFEHMNLMTGRFGAIVALQQMNQSADRTLLPIGNRLCQHVIGYSPSYIELPDNIRKHLESAEKERLELAKNSTPNSEDGECIDSDEEQTGDSRDDWPSIMDQSLIMSEELTVREFCKQNEISIVYFNRFECGQDS